MTRYNVINSLDYKTVASNLYLHDLVNEKYYRMLQRVFWLFQCSRNRGAGYGLEIRQSKINSRWVAGPIGQTNRRPSV